MPTTDIENIQALVSSCARWGLRHIVFSPGSRSAPLVIGFTAMPQFNCMAIPDERVAGFFALGLAQQTKQPVALVCTSGTAVLNLAPAICEAYYQQIPLLILTADRPPEFIGIGENQAIEQTDIYKNYIKASYTLPDDIQAAANMAVHALTESSTGQQGPVHINIALREPLYGQTDQMVSVLAFDRRDSSALPKAEINPGKRNMLICGMQDADKNLQKIIAELSQREDFVIITEPLSNIQGRDTISKVDATLTLIADAEPHLPAPDTIITIGKQIVSKKLRQYLRKVKPARHIHLSTDNGQWDGLGAANYEHLHCDVLATLKKASQHGISLSDFRAQWMRMHDLASARTDAYAGQVPFSDWQIFNTLTRTYPAKAQIQYGNSSPIRYAGFFDHAPKLSIHANRGTSGIDGCVSTAAGAAYQHEGLTICVVGDISFLYDSNALWNNYLSPQLRIIVINNGGGNIFRLIEGPKQVPGFDCFFETAHQRSVEFLAKMYQIPYYFCDRSDDLEKTLKTFYKPKKGRPAILEIKTDGAISEQAYKDYFTFLKIK